MLASAREGYRKRDVNLGDVWEIARYRGFWRVALRELEEGGYTRCTARCASPFSCATCSG